MPSAVPKHHDLVHDVQRDQKPPSSEFNPQPMMDTNDVITLNEAAALLRIHPVTLRKRAVAWVCRIGGSARSGDSPARY
jgi:hypothetical protein